MPLNKNKNPIKNAGKEIIKKLEGISYVLKQIVNIIERIIKIIPPIFSCFQAMNKNKARMKFGIR